MRRGGRLGPHPLLISCEVLKPSKKCTTGTLPASVARCATSARSCSGREGCITLEFYGLGWSRAGAEQQLASISRLLLLLLLHILGQ